ncbi:MAG: glucan biosynthesis protein D [Verrucomicrobia bacterium]|jgi:glucans biosynthesis protein|nr:glucan biosynthesis protein D [Verrucomicrobiota bacterium]
MERRQVSFDSVREQAKSLAEREYEPMKANLPELFRELDYAGYREIEFRPDKALWLEDQLPFQVQLFHRGYLYEDPVFVHEYTDTHVQELPYVREFFNFRALEIEDFPSRAAGYAGLRLHARINSQKFFDEFLVFLGASYFRSLGMDQRYGLSARALMIPHGPGEGEEFPRLVEFWLRKPAADSKSLTVLALMDSPSVTGAYRFDITPGERTRMKVLATLYPRRPLEQIGLGALTSMFYFGENTQPKPDDFRPEVHDSDGLGMRFEDGSVAWRPLESRPAEVRSRYSAKGLVSFGLYQRDRAFASYLDHESLYQDRPSARMSLGTGFTDGEVLLRELPPKKDFFDNIVAAYVPADSLEPGKAYAYAYTLEWGTFHEEDGPAQVVSTRHGADLHATGKEIFLIEFELTDALAGNQPELSASVSDNARIVEQSLRVDRARDLVLVNLQVVPEKDGHVFLSAGLEQSGKSVSETWMYRWNRYD